MMGTALGYTYPLGYTNIRVSQPPPSSLSRRAPHARRRPHSPRKEKATPVERDRWNQESGQVVALEGAHRERREHHPRAEEDAQAAECDAVAELVVAD